MKERSVELRILLSLKDRERERKKKKKKKRVKGFFFKIGISAPLY